MGMHSLEPEKNQTTTATTATTTTATPKPFGSVRSFWKPGRTKPVVMHRGTARRKKKHAQLQQSSLPADRYRVFSALSDSCCSAAETIKNTYCSVFCALVGNLTPYNTVKEMIQEGFQQKTTARTLIPAVGDSLRDGFLHKRPVPDFPRWPCVRTCVFLVVCNPDDAPNPPFPFLPFTRPVRSRSRSRPPVGLDREREREHKIATRIIGDIPSEGIQPRKHAHRHRRRLITPWISYLGNRPRLTGFGSVSVRVFIGGVSLRGEADSFNALFAPSFLPSFHPSVLLLLFVSFGWIGSG